LLVSFPLADPDREKEFQTLIRIVQGRTSSTTFQLLPREPNVTNVSRLSKDSPSWSPKASMIQTRHVAASLNGRNLIRDLGQSGLTGRQLQ
jgi:hypothetical protein